MGKRQSHTHTHSWLLRVTFTHAHRHGHTDARGNTHTHVHTLPFILDSYILGDGQWGKSERHTLIPVSSEVIEVNEHRNAARPTV